MVVSVVFEHDDGGRRVAPLMVTVVIMNLMVATPMPVVIMVDHWRDRHDGVRVQIPGGADVWGTARRTVAGFWSGVRYSTVTRTTMERE